MSRKRVSHASLLDSVWRLAGANAFHILLVLPVLVFMVGFFVLPLSSMLVRSFQGGTRGIAAIDEVARPLESHDQVFQLQHPHVAQGPAGLNPEDIRVVRTLPVRAVDAARGLLILEAPVLGDVVVRVSYNDIANEVALPQSEGNGYLVAHPPIRPQHGDGSVTTSDVKVLAERSAEVAEIDRDKGRLTLREPLSSSEALLVSYRYQAQFTLSHYLKAIGSSFYMDWRPWKPSLFRTTFEIAVFTALACVLIGYPVAYFLNSVPPAWRAVLIPLVLIPFWTSVLVRTFAWQVILGKAGLVNFLLTRTGLTSQPLPMVFDRFGVYVGMVHILLPYVIFPTLAVMLRIPQYPVMAAASLGARPLRSFLRVYLPLSLPGPAVGSLIVFILSLGFFVTPELLGGRADRMVSNLVEVQFSMNGDWEFGAAMSFLVLLPTIPVYLLYARFMKLEGLHTGGIHVALRAEPNSAGTSPPIRRRSISHSPVHFSPRRPPRPHAPRRNFRSLNWEVMMYVSAALLTGLGVFLARRIYEVPPLLIGLFCLLAAGTVILAQILARFLAVQLSRTLLAAFCSIVFLYFLLPNVIVIPMSLTNHPVFLDFPGRGFTLKYFASFFGAAEATHFGAGGWLAPALSSAEIALLVVILSVPLGSLAGYGLIRGTFPGRQILMYLVISPLIVPTLVLAIAIFMFFSSYMGYMLQPTLPFGFVRFSTGFVIAHSILAIPYVVLITVAALRNLDPILEQAAMSVGARPLTTLRRVVFPLIAPALISSALFAFLASFDELVIAIFLSNARVTTLPKRMWDGVRNEVDPTITAISTMLVFLTLLVMSAAALTKRIAEARDGVPPG
jgi:putative spermidine/putrescine transport system permease protein